MSWRGQDFRYRRPRMFKRMPPTSEEIEKFRHYGVNPYICEDCGGKAKLVRHPDPQKYHFINQYCKKCNKTIHWRNAEVKVAQATQRQALRRQNLMSVDEMANYTGATHQFLRYLASTKQVPFIRMFNRVFFLRSEADIVKFRTDMSSQGRRRHHTKEYLLERRRQLRAVGIPPFPEEHPPQQPNS